MREHFTPCVLIFRNRSEFYELLQLDEEKISVWYLKINNDASYCKFGKMFNGKDRFIPGMQEGFVLNTSFEKNMKVCTSKELLDIALNIEAGFTYEHENIYFTLLFTTTSSRDHNFSKFKFKSSIFIKCLPFEEKQYVQEDSFILY